jgi:phosphohistidine phosphatase
MGGIIIPPALPIPCMDVYILRHGRAEDARKGMTDADRRLTAKGRVEIEGVAAWMAAQEIAFNLIATSPLARAEETAGIVAAGLGLQKKLKRWDVLAPGTSPDEICHAIDGVATLDAVLLVGHEPQLSALIGRIIVGSEDAGIAMTKGALAKIRNYSFHAHPAGELHWLVTAKQMNAAVPRSKKPGPETHVFIR